MEKMHRRDFLKLVAGSIGGALLTANFGCSAGSGGSPIPNGYRFYRLMNTGDVTSDGFTLDAFYGSAHIGSRGIVTFDARNAGNQGGIFQLYVDFASGRPVVDGDRTALLVGETLADGRIVARFNARDVNDAGSIATAIVAGNAGPQPLHLAAGLYLETEGRGFEPVVSAGDTFGDSGCYSTGTFGDVDLHDNDDLLVVAHHAPDGAGATPGQGLFHLPGSARASSRRLTTTGDPIAGTDHVLASLGLVDLHDGGHWVAQGNATAPAPVAAEGLDPQDSGTILLAGNIAAPAEVQILVSSAGIATGDYVGESIYGPRIGPEGKKLKIVGLSEDEECLVFDDRIVLRSGDPSPAGGEVLGFGPGAIGCDGIVYYTLVSRNYAGMALVAFNGREHRVILSRGDFLCDGGLPVESILFGTTTGHVDCHGRIVLLCEFGDGSMSLVAGIPC